MPKFKHCFIMENGTYKEIPYENLFVGEERNPQFQSRYFLPFHGCLMEVNEVDYKAHYREKRRQQYLYEQEMKNKVLFVDALDTDDQVGIDTLVDTTAPSVDELVGSKIMLGKLRNVLGELADGERELIKNLFFDNIGERQIAKLHGVSLPFTRESTNYMPS